MPTQATSTAENYAKALYQLQQKQTDNSPVSLGQLADQLGVTPGTATTMVKRFADDGLVRYTPRKGARLTPGGMKLALAVLRRHRIIETFLVEVLGLDWAEVHEEAEVLEHAVSEKVLDKLDALLGHPTADPHGSPIPPAPGAGPMRMIEMRPLTDCRPGQRVTVSRLLDTLPRFLQFAERNGLTPGAAVRVIANDPAADAITVKVGRAAPTTLGSAAAGKVLVTGE
ncbi:MAG: metal-dependent transcriptional regulator [Phycisphaerales bacterium JB063]